MTRFYAQTAPELVNLGYDVTPVRGKRAFLTGWQQRPQEALQFDRHGACNVGVLTGGLHRLIAVDVDVLHAACAAELRNLIEVELGFAPLRIGKAPKFLMLFRCSEQLTKRKTAVFDICGDEAAIEILAEGQQFVAVGIHPDTGSAYDWPHDSIETLPPQALTLVQPEALDAFLDKATNILARYGTTGRAPSVAAVPQTRLRLNNLAADPAEIAVALEYIPNREVHYDDWIATLHAIKGAVGDGGCVLAHRWSAKSSKYDSATTDVAWQSIKTVHSIGAGTLFQKANQYGFDLQSFRDARSSAAGQLSNQSAPLSDDDLAERFSAKYADDLRYVATLGQWFRWTGEHWAHDDTLGVSDLARSLCREAAQACEKPKSAASIASAKTISAVERLIRTDRRHAATVAEWDQNLWLLNTPAGTVDLRNGTMHAHDRSDLITRITPVVPSGACPNWLEHLQVIFDGDSELISFLQRVAGYALTGSTQEHALFFGYGTGANGKSVTIDTIAGMMGEYHRTAAMEVFTASNGDRHPTELARLRGARLVTSTETEEGRQWAESRIKSLTGGDVVAARFMRQDFFEYVPQFKLLLAGNHKPGLRNTDEAIRRRLHLIPFTVTIPPERRDKDLKAKLQDEWPGILAWAICGASEWYANGLVPPTRVTEATQNYLSQEDAFLIWFDECCEADANTWERSSDLFRSWKLWAEQSGETVGSQKRFSQSLEARGFVAERRRARGFAGLRLKR
jgi:putative DNA primase/helicase